MSGHSKWASIKHKKAATDAKRGAMFTKLIRELTAAARQGGGNAETNVRLRAAIIRAKSQNMPTSNIENAIKKGTGELPGIVYEEMSYEGYGPKGVAIMVETLTDNKNRTTAELRNLFSKKNGNLAGAGSVAWMFNKKGYIAIEKKDIEEEKLMNIVLDAGAEDMKTEEEVYEITTAPADLEKVKKAIEQKNIKIQSAEITMIPSSTIEVTGADAKTNLELVESLEEHEDVQHVYANFDIPDEILKENQ
ncbi:MAG: YebC/PmpR family DNA-binding transcriptional regulator [Candidatus Omnitrophica bacterium]|nr:YebC/PmpR family DNA-binding transcriptional regulator [Candidatus Omnitrophota bacterium]MDD5352332.1 YebC/PmpR family DNA-binding transcriptional regulator [Candidatus Omnitrophota bacterium]MDD5549930.1 YebC/PmpR family DNA-binding transcriptional regulator [Candidatus Omnitrophota bacterium]